MQFILTEEEYNKLKNDKLKSSQMEWFSSELRRLILKYKENNDLPVSFTFFEELGKIMKDLGNH